MEINKEYFYVAGALIFVFFMVLMFGSSILVASTPTSKNIGTEAGSALRGGLLAEATCPSGYIYCANFNLCFVSWVDCNTIQYCYNGYYGCASGNKLCCYQGNNPLCIGTQYDCNTIYQCAGSYWVCTTNNVGVCCNNQPHCCPSGYTKMDPYCHECWMTGWECTVDAHCQSGYICQSYKCVVNPCIRDKNMDGTCYYSYDYGPFNCPQCSLKAGFNAVVWKGATQSTDNAVADIKNNLESIWFYDGCDWFVWSPVSPSNLPTMTNNYCYTFKTNAEINWYTIKGSLQLVFLSLIKALGVKI